MNPNVPSARKVEEPPKQKVADYEEQEKEQELEEVEEGEQEEQEESEAEISVFCSFVLETQGEELPIKQPLDLSSQSFIRQEEMPLRQQTAIQSEKERHMMTNTFYVELFCVRDFENSQPNLLFQEMKVFLAETKATCLLIQGDSGSGKTLSLIKFKELLEKDVLTAQRRTIKPFFIDLRESGFDCNSEPEKSDFIAEYLKDTLEMSETEIFNLQHQQDFVLTFLMDGFDELQWNESYNTFDMFCLDEWSKKGIFTFQFF